MILLAPWSATRSIAGGRGFAAVFRESATPLWKPADDDWNPPNGDAKNFENDIDGRREQ